MSVDSAPFVSRLVQRLKWFITLTAGASAVATMCNLLNRSSDRFTAFCALVVAFLAAALFLLAVFDIRLQRAVSALNADRRAQAREKGWLSRVTGLSLPLGDRALFVVGVPLAGLALFAADVAHRTPATALSFAGFFLVALAQIALTVRGYPSDKFVAPFS